MIRELKVSRKEKFTHPKPVSQREPYTLRNDAELWGQRSGLHRESNSTDKKQYFFRLSSWRIPTRRSESVQASATWTKWIGKPFFNLFFPNGIFRVIIISNSYVLYFCLCTSNVFNVANSLLGKATFSAMRWSSRNTTIPTLYTVCVV